jgi:hypothetical protein
MSDKGKTSTRARPEKGALNVRYLFQKQYEGNVKKVRAKKRTLGRANRAAAQVHDARPHAGQHQPQPQPPNPFDGISYQELKKAGYEKERQVCREAAVSLYAAWSTSFANTASIAHPPLPLHHDGGRYHKERMVLH